MAARAGWIFKRDGDAFRRVVPSPEPKRIFELRQIGWLLEQGCVVICGGGGGIPTHVRRRTASSSASRPSSTRTTPAACWPRTSSADWFVMATDVDAVYVDWGKPTAAGDRPGPPGRADGASPPASPPARWARRSSPPASSSRPPASKAGIGGLTDIDEMLAGERGTIVTNEVEGIEFRTPRTGRLGGEQMGIGVHSEVGKLRKVMVHRPGLEHTRLTPANAEDLLFDDVLWVKQAKKEHDAFCEAMRERGVEVFEVEYAARRGAGRTRRRASGSCDHALNERMVGPVGAQRAREWVADRRPARRSPTSSSAASRPGPARRHGLLFGVVEPTDILLPPLPNFIFQRDPSCWIYGGVTLNPMAKPARKPETMYLEAIYRFHPMFTANGGVKVWFGGAERGLGPGDRRGRRRPGHRQRRRDDRHGRAHHATGRLADRPRAVRGRCRQPRCWPSTCRSRAPTCTSTRS